MSPFIFYGVIQILISAFMPYIIPKSVNTRLKDSQLSLEQSISQLNDEIDQEEKGMIKRTKIRIVDFFINPKILFATLAGAMFQFNLACLEPNFVIVIGIG